MSDNVERKNIYTSKDETEFSTRKEAVMRNRVLDARTYFVEKTSLFSRENFKSENLRIEDFLKFVNDLNAILKGKKVD